jgi:hypothetical protein
MDEYIEREAAINEVLIGNIDKDYPRMDIAARLHDLPAADVRPVGRGKWIKYAPDNSDMMTCSECEKYWILDGEQYDFHFCPNCGAMMDES